MDLHIKDIVELKKTHPCGSKQWELTRVGMDIKLRWPRLRPRADAAAVPRGEKH